MSWVKLDDGFAEHPKIQDLTNRAFRLHVVALCYCGRNLTNGFIGARSLKIVAATIGATSVTKNVDELIAAGLWVRESDGHSIKDYLEYNPSADKVRGERIKARERMARGRARAAGCDVDDSVEYSAILERDGYVCHLCGQSVLPREVSFDHVIPLDAGGPHSEDNIRVAHLQCNFKKNNCVPEKFAGSSGEHAANNSEGCSPSPTRPVLEDQEHSTASISDSPVDKSQAAFLEFANRVGLHGKQRLDAFSLGPQLLDEALRVTACSRPENEAAYFTTCVRNLLSAQTAWRSGQPLEQRLVTYVRAAGWEYEPEMLTEELLAKGADGLMVERLLVLAKSLRAREAA